MSFLDRIAVCRIADMSAYRPFVIDGRHLGWVKDDFAAVLRDRPDVFAVTDAAVTLNDKLKSFEDRSETVGGFIHEIKDTGVVKLWYDEIFPVKDSHAAEPLFEMERGAIALFGLPAFGVHVNGFVGSEADKKMWVGTRALDRPLEPGKLDQIVAGGQPADLTIAENLAKECEEEAGIDAATAARAVPVSAITYTMERPEGLRQDVLYVYDLDLDPGFTPACADGEIETFQLMSLEEVAAIVRDTDDFKFNCSLVVIDFLIRHGFITPDHPEYIDCIRELRS